MVKAFQKLASKKSSFTVYPTILSCKLCPHRGLHPQGGSPSPVSALNQKRIQEHSVLLRAAWILFLFRSACVTHPTTSILYACLILYLFHNLLFCLQDVLSATALRFLALLAHHLYFANSCYC